MLLPLAPFTCTCTLALRRGTKSPPECHKNTKAGEKVRVKGSSSTCHLCRGLCQPPRWPRDAEADSGGSQAGLRELACFGKLVFMTEFNHFIGPNAIVTARIQRHKYAALCTLFYIILLWWHYLGGITKSSTKKDYITRIAIPERDYQGGTNREALYCPQRESRHQRYKGINPHALPSRKMALSLWHCKAEHQQTR